MVFTVLLCPVRISEQTATFVFYDINKLFFMTEIYSVYSAVRTESLFKGDTVRLKVVNMRRGAIMYWHKQPCILAVLASTEAVVRYALSAVAIWSVAGGWLFPQGPSSCVTSLSAPTSGLPTCRLTNRFRFVATWTFQGTFAMQECRRPNCCYPSGSSSSLDQR
jgi:hypothetical protein